VTAGAEPRPGQREPWAEAHVATARLVLAACAGDASPRLASFDDGLAVQRVLAGAARADQRGRRVPIG
jgi:predicted dehydrogenase